MIDFYSWPTPNGLKVSILFAEAGIEHRVHPINIGKGEQFTPEFLAIAPNNRIPAIVDHAPTGGGAPIALFESGAILLYIAEKTGQFIPGEIGGRTEVLQWLFWQMGGLGPMAGQNGHFNVYATEQIPYAQERYINETARLYGVMDKRLADREFLAGDYSIADMACYPWIIPHEAHKQDLGKHVHLKRWFDAIAARPAVVKVYAEKAAIYAVPDQPRPITDEERKVLFGKR